MSIVSDIKKKYKEISDQIRQTSQNDEEIELGIIQLNSDLSVSIARSSIITDDEKIELLELLTEESDKIRIIESLESDDKKVKLLGLIQRKQYKIRIIESLESDDIKIKLLGLKEYDEWDKVQIIISLKEDDKKIEALPLIKDEEPKAIIIQRLESEQKKLDCIDTISDSTRKAGILLSISDLQLVKDFLSQNEEVKEHLVKHLCQQPLWLVKEHWALIKATEIEYLIIPSVFSGARNYKEMKNMDDEMKTDIEKYLGKKIPDDISQVSRFEQVGVDFEALQTRVIVDEKQLSLDEMEQQFLQSLSLSDGNSKKIVMLKDFVGTIAPNLKYGVAPIEIKTWEDLIRNLNRMEENIRRHSEAFLFNGNRDNEVRLEGAHGKYWVVSNGNHTMALLKAKYLTEIMRAQGNPEKIAEIDKKYTIEVHTANEVPEDKEELVGIIILKEIMRLQAGGNIEKSLNDRIYENIEKGRKKGYRIRVGEQNIILRDVTEIKDYIGQKLQELRIDGNQYDTLISVLSTCRQNEKYSQAFDLMLGEEKKQEEVLNYRDELREESVKENERILPEKLEENKEKKTETDTHEPVNIELWNTRFKNWDSATRNSSKGGKRKFVEIKRDFINNLKNLLKNRGKNQERTNDDGGRS